MMKVYPQFFCFNRRAELTYTSKFPAYRKIKAEP